jgi:hypothetical protein
MGKLRKQDEELDLEVEEYFTADSSFENEEDFDEVEMRDWMTEEEDNMTEDDEEMDNLRNDKEEEEDESDEEDNDQPGVTIRWVTLGDKRRRIV